MSVLFRFSGSLSNFTHNKKIIVCEPSFPVRHYLNSYKKEFCNFNQLLDDEGDFLPQITVFVNGVNINALQGTLTVLEDGDQVDIIPTAAGG
jgi:molybdopterin converting factor small subunit